MTRPDDDRLAANATRARFGHRDVRRAHYGRAVAWTTIVFDLDGTLTDSEPGIVASYRHALATFGRKVDDAAIRRWIGPPLGEGLAALGVPAGEIDAAIIAYRAYFTETGMYGNSLFDGVAEMLGKLRGSEMTLAVATSKLQEFAETILDHFRISHHFAVVAGSTRDGSRMIKEEIMAFALASLGQPDPATVAVVGDREQDMRAAVHHGLYAIGAGWGYGTLRELRESGSDVIVEDPTALALLLGGGQVHGLAPGSTPA